MKEEKKNLIRYRMNMASATLKDAQVLLNEGGSLWSVINRAYYAMFYSTLALLILIGKGTAKHGGVIGIFDQEFVKKGVFPHEMSRWLHKAFDLRQIGDYRELVELTHDQAKEVLQWAEDFVRQAEAFLASKMAEDEADAR